MVVGPRLPVCVFTYIGRRELKIQRFRDLFLIIRMIIQNERLIAEPMKSPLNFFTLTAPRHLTQR
jgi:hypothetical protein